MVDGSKRTFTAPDGKWSPRFTNKSNTKIAIGALLAFRDKRKEGDKKKGRVGEDFGLPISH